MRILKEKRAKFGKIDRVFDEIPKEGLEKQGESEEILIGGESDPMISNHQVLI